jgi:hypothetical protein
MRSRYPRENRKIQHVEVDKLRIGERYLYQVLVGKVRR